MSYIKAVYLDVNNCCDDFVKGVELLEQCSISDSVEYFKRACESVSYNDRFLSKYKSYYGLSKILNGDVKALQICRNAVRQHPFDGDICMNLVRAEMFLNNRLDALDVIETGLRYSAGHDGLQQLKMKLGVRMRKPLPLLPRSNPISAALGRRMRRRNQ